MNTYKINFPKLLNSAVITLFLLSSTTAFAMDTGEDLGKGSITRIAPSNGDNLLDEVLEETVSPQSATVSPDELKLQELQRKAEIARLQRQIAEDEAAARAASLLNREQGKGAVPPSSLGELLYGFATVGRSKEEIDTMMGGRSKARVERNINKVGRDVANFLSIFAAGAPTSPEID